MLPGATSNNGHQQSPRGMKRSRSPNEYSDVVDDDGNQGQHQCLPRLHSLALRALFNQHVTDNQFIYRRSSSTKTWSAAQIGPESHFSHITTILYGRPSPNPTASKPVSPSNITESDLSTKVDTDKNCCRKSITNCQRPHNRSAWAEGR